MALSPACTCLSCPAHPGAGSASAAGAFGLARAGLESVVSWLGGPAAGAAGHGELEDRLLADSREVFRLLLQGHLDLRAAREARCEGVTGADGVVRTRVEKDHQRGLATVLGEVTVTRMAYRAPGKVSLYPADGVLNLPAGKHSHGLRRLAAAEASRGSFDEAVAAVGRATGQRPGKRQAECLAAAAAADFGSFYAARRPPPGGRGDLLVLSCDGKGIVMRPGALRPATARAARKASAKLATRLTRGEVRHRKRSAEVGAVYDAVPAPRAPGDILPASSGQRRAARPGPRAARKWLTASVTGDAASVVALVFDEAQRRDPGHARTWIALVDGNNHQIRRIQAEAAAREAPVTIVCDFIHVLEYLWKAAWCFHAEADPAAEDWVRAQAAAVLAGHATAVAGLIRRTAGTTQLSRARLKAAGAAAAYLTSKAPCLDYPAALQQGWPIATGVIEGACRHLVIL